MVVAEASRLLTLVLREGDIGPQPREAGFSNIQDNAPGGECSGGASDQPSPSSSSSLSPPAAETSSSSDLDSSDLRAMQSYLPRVGVSWRGKSSREQLDALVMGMGFVGKYMEFISPHFSNLCGKLNSSVGIPLGHWRSVRGCILRLKYRMLNSNSNILGVGCTYVMFTVISGPGDFCLQSVS